MIYFGSFFFSLIHLKLKRQVRFYALMVPLKTIQLKNHTFWGGCSHSYEKQYACWKKVSQIRQPKFQIHILFFSWWVLFSIRSVRFFFPGPYKLTISKYLVHCIWCINFQTDMSSLEFSNQETEYKLRRGKSGYFIVVSSQPKVQHRSKIGWTWISIFWFCNFI